MIPSDNGQRKYSKCKMDVHYYAIIIYMSTSVKGIRPLKSYSGERTFEL